MNSISDIQNRIIKYMLKDTFIHFIVRVAFLVYVLLKISNLLELLGISKAISYSLICGISMFSRLVLKDNEKIDSQYLEKKIDYRHKKEVYKIQESILLQSLGAIGAAFLVLLYVEMYL